MAYGAVWSYRPLESPNGPREQRAEDTAKVVAADAGLTSADTLGELGDPAAAILRTAEEQEADVIVVASHDRGWLSRLLQPSVTKAVVKQSALPVLVVR